MKVSSQIKLRMSQLGVGVPELAKRLKCSQQTVRYWVSGRNMPKKQRAAALEQALSFSIDWSEGAKSTGPSAQAMLNEADVQLMMKMSGLPVKVKIILGELVDAISESGEVIRSVKREVRKPMIPFSERQQGTADGKRQRGRKAA